MFTSPTLERQRRMRAAMQLMQQDPGAAQLMLTQGAPNAAPPPQPAPTLPPPPPANGTSPFSPPPRNPAVAALMNNPPASATPPPADDIVVTAPQPPRTPYDPGALAMDRAANPVQPAAMTWGDRLQIAGATMQQMARPDNQIATTVTGIRAQGRQQAQDEERQRLAAAQIAGVRKILDQERLKWDDIQDSADNPKPRWEQTWVMQMARLASSPEEFLRLYAARTEAEANRQIQRDDLTMRGGQFDREMGWREKSGDRDYELRKAQGDREYELGRGSLNVQRMNAETARKQAEQGLEFGVKDPMVRGLLQRDLGSIEQFDTEAETAARVGGALKQFASLNARQPTGALFADGSPIFGINPNDDWKTMQAIQNQLFPIMGESMKGVLSETDAARIESGTVNVSNPTEVNNRIVGMHLEGMRRAQERATEARLALRSERSLDRFNRDWAQYINDVSADPKQRGERAPITFAQWRAEQARIAELEAKKRGGQ